MELLSKYGVVKEKSFFIPLIVVIVAAIAVFLLMATAPDVEEEESEFPPLVIEVTEAQFDEKLRTSRFQGEVRAKTNIELVSQVTGKVMSVSDKFIEGGQFAANEPILRIDDADYRVALKSAEASVAEAEVELDIELASAETNKKEWLDLVGGNIEEANPLRLNKPQVQRSRARLDAAKAQLAQAQLDLSRTVISAPFAGRILSKSAERGQFVARGAGLGRVFSTDSVEIRISMSDLQISDLGIRLGQVLEGESLAAKVTTRFGIIEHEWQGYLKSVDASVDRETRLLFGTIVVNSPFELRSESSIPLAPGLFVDVELNAAKKISGVSVPRSALRNGNKVYVANGNVLNVRKVQALFTSSDVAVLSVDGEAGVVPGDKVIISPVPGAYEGMAIEIKGQNVKPASNNVAKPAQENKEKTESDT